MGSANRRRAGDGSLGRFKPSRGSPRSCRRRACIWYHGVFAPHHALRAAITPAGRGRGARHSDAERPVSKHVSMTWMQRLKRVFAIEIERCRRCGGKLKVIASIEDPALIGRILAHRKSRAEREHEGAPFGSRAPPPQRSLV